jgi:hypothetical protein
VNTILAYLNRKAGGTKVNALLKEVSVRNVGTYFEIKKAFTGCTLLFQKGLRFLAFFAAHIFARPF